MSEINSEGFSKYVRCHGWSKSPLENLPAESIHLITATCEPFGLTVPECIGAGIPVISSRCGGPEEMLPSNCLYDIGDASGCAALLENLMTNEGSYFDAVAETRLMHEGVLDDGKQLESLGIWSQKYFEKH